MSQNSDPKKNVNLTESSNFYEENFLPKLLADYANLREFGQQVSIIRDLEMKGKLSRFESSEEIKRLWTRLKQESDSVPTGDKDYC